MEESEADILITDRFWSLGLRDVAFRRVSYVSLEVEFLLLNSSQSFSPGCSGCPPVSLSYGFEALSPTG